MIDGLEAEIDDLVDLLQGDDAEEAARDAADARIRELSAQIDSIAHKPPAIDEELKPQLGAFLLLDEAGCPRMDPVFYSERAPANDENGGDARGSASVAADRPQKGGGLSQRLVDELAIQRRDILAVHVAADPGLALDLAIFLMVDRDAGYSAEKSGSSLIALAPANPVFDFKTPDAAATIARDEASGALDRSWTEAGSKSERFDAFRSLGEEARAAWLGHAVARTLEASLNLAGERSCAFHDHLGRLLGIDVARWWRPTGANFFDRVPKGATLAALEAVGGPELAARYSKAKKAELAQSCERIFSGDFIAEVEVKEAALTWVPEPMRFAEVRREPEAQSPAGRGQCAAPEIDPGEEEAVESDPSGPESDAIEEAA